jgi:lycopene cyclase domain-containing protein
LIYLGWLGLFIGLPLAVLWLARGRQLWRRRRALGLTLLGALIFGGLWDGLAVRVHIWYYAPANISGVWLAGLPLEEWLWILGTTLLFASLAMLLQERRRHA